MSPKTTSNKLNLFFHTYFGPALLALILALILSQQAFADSQSAIGDQETTETEQVITDETEDAADPKKAMELPPVEDSKVGSEPGTDKTMRIVEPVPDTEKNIQSLSDAGAPLAEKCYEQKDGSFECVCEGEEECEALKTAEHCEPGSHWGKDGYGGCTKSETPE